MANYCLFLILGLANCVRSGTYPSNLSGYTKSGVLDQLSGLCCVLRVKGVSGNSSVEPISLKAPNILRENKNYKSEIINPLVGEENETFCAYVSNSQENYVRARNSGELLSFFKGNNNASFLVFSRKQMLKNKKLDYLLRTNKSGFILCDELSPSPSPSRSRDGRRELPNELLEKEVFKTSDEKIMARPNGKYAYCSPSPLQKSSEGISEGLSTLKFLPTKDLAKHLCERRPKAREILTLIAANVSSVKRNVSLVVLSSAQLVEGLDKWRKGLIRQKLPKKLLGQILRKTRDNRRIPFRTKRHSITASSKSSKATPSLGSSADTKQLSPETTQINSHEQQQPRLSTEGGRNKRKLTTIKTLSSWSVLPNNAVRREPRRDSSRGRSRSPHPLVKRRNVFETSPQTTNRFHNDEGKDESLLKWRRKHSTWSSIGGRGAESANTLLHKETNDEDNKTKEADKLIEELKNTTKKNESLTVGGRPKRSPQQEFLLRRSLHPEFVLEKVSLAYFETQPQEPSENIFELPTKEAVDLEKESTNMNRKTSRGTNSLESSEKNHLRHHRNKKRKAAAAVLAAEGHSALLPCDVTSRVEHDAPILLMWFREGTHTPLFSVDFRQGTKGRPQIGHDLASPMTQRATLHVTTESQFYSREFLRSSNYSIDDLELFTASGGNLEINPVMLADEGVYKCRVDFLHSPTRNDRVNLTILSTS